MQPIRTILPFLKPYRWHMVVVVLSTFAVTGMSLVSPWLIRELIRVIREGQGSGDSSAITWLAVALIAAYVLRSLGHYLKAYVAHVVAWNIVSDLQSKLYRHLQSLSIGFYSDRQSGELASRVTSDTRDIEPVFAHALPDGIVYSLMIIGVCIALFSLNAVLTLMVLIPIPFLVFAVSRFAKGEHGGFQLALSSMGSLQAKVQDNLSGMKEIQIFAQEKREGHKVHNLAKTATDQRLFALKMQALIPASVELAAGIGTVLIVWFGGRLALNGEMAVEDLVAFVLYLALLYQPIQVLAYMNEGIQMGIASARRVSDILSLEPEVADPPNGIDPLRVAGRVTFQHVNFGYLQSVPVIQDVSLTVEAGQVLALVGPTGAGKSTLTSLVGRFYDPQAGQMKIDDIDIRDMKLEALRRNISMVLQDVFLFNGTVRENIRFSRPEATDEEIMQAAKIAAAHDFIMELPDGYNTLVGERGIKLSGGQKQRLAIARAVLKDAPILILDEATSSIDTQTEADIQAALWRLMQGRTSIVVAHRLSTIRDADLIAVVDDGRVIERGKHQDLMARSGLYRQLYEKQFKTKTAV